MKVRLITSIVVMLVTAVFSLMVMGPKSVVKPVMTDQMASSSITPSLSVKPSKSLSTHSHKPRVKRITKPRPRESNPATIRPAQKLSPSPSPEVTHTAEASPAVSAVPSPSISPPSRTPGALRAVAYALSQIGCPYAYGGAGPCRDGYDCSGLTMAAWAVAGVTIPRTSEAQWASLPHVAPSGMQPGDILIFYSAASHVGLYVGDGYMVDSSRPGIPVQKVSITGYYAHNLKGVVRP